MTDATPPLTPILTWLISLLVPLALIVLAVRLIMTPLFLQVEYRTPGFPPDPYGFSLEDRLYWSEISLDVLVNLREISYVESLQFEDGSPVYNQRELGHWVDAIKLWRNVSRVGYGATIILIGLGVWAWQGGWWASYRMALGRGGFWTVAFMGVILIFVAIAFTALFTGFHQLFFPPGTWQFPFSDTFIRLFPQRFWRDAFIAVGLFSAGGGLALWYFLVRRA